METITITLEQPIQQFVHRQSRDRDIPPQDTVIELMILGFETLLEERYNRYRRGEVSFGRLAQELGTTTWELSHLLEERGLPVYNLPAAR